LTENDPKKPTPVLVTPDEWQALFERLEERNRIRLEANLAPEDFKTTYAGELGRLAAKNYFRLVLPYLAEADRLIPDYTDVPRSYAPRFGRYHETRGRYVAAMARARAGLFRDTGIILDVTLAGTFDEFQRLYRAGKLPPLSSITSTTPNKGEENE
jgi:hypothetical protein